jgi:hypothetical protein
MQMRTRVVAETRKAESLLHCAIPVRVNLQRTNPIPPFDIRPATRQKRAILAKKRRKDTVCARESTFSFERSVAPRRPRVNAHSNSRRSLVRVKEAGTLIPEFLGLCGAAGDVQDRMEQDSLA